MRRGESSRSAWSAANYRAAHQLVDRVRLFEDPYALPILGVGEDVVRAGRQASPEAVRMRYFIAGRSRLGTDVAEAAIARGSQVVVLGAGLDTFGYRHPGDVVYEVDHPDTQVWKGERLADAGIDVPASVRFVPVDFEQDDLAARLVDAGLDGELPACFLWLGVVPYLTRPGFETTLAFTGGAPGNEVVLDYTEPFEMLGPQARRGREAAMERVAAIGEPWQLFLTHDDMAATLAAAGFDEVDDIGPDDFGARFLGRPPAAVAERRAGGHLVHARCS